MKKPFDKLKIKVSKGRYSVEGFDYKISNRLFVKDFEKVLKKEKGKSK